ncbi:hypothetical protein AAFF_G00292360 [Aldrovandia affinis]|uniref:Uncharacterized protein n=1 Tax=Aldrovandia affinis TaxID=143900 RepID=A0AAD7SQW9_9TELE|nr:hypothetical protein AAFF_G00292360 [Aldrovandia affinis]
MVDVVPVKNEEGLVIMFILNFELTNESKPPVSPPRNIHRKLPIPWLSSARRCGFKLHLPLLRSGSVSKHSLQDDAEAGCTQDTSHLVQDGSLALGELLTPPEPPPCPGSPATLWPQRPLPDGRPVPLPLPLHLPQSSLQLHRLGPGASLSNCSLARSRSHESVHSMRRVSSVDDIETVRPDWDRKPPTRCVSTGAMNNKSAMQNSTSDPDLVRYRALSAIPQITLNFVDFKPDPFITLPAGEVDIIAPCKLIDRTHNVTEKVTQVMATPGPSLPAAGRAREAKPRAHVGDGSWVPLIERLAGWH